MQVQTDKLIVRPRAEVFAYLARAEFLPDYVTEFAWVRQSSEGEPALGTEYSYKMVRGEVQGTFQWTEFVPHSRLAWHGPAAKAGPGSMEPAGWWQLADQDSGTRVSLVMAPIAGGLLKAMEPLIAMGLRRGNDEALERLRQRLESPNPPTG